MVVYHWRHFGELAGNGSSQPPFFSLLKVFYEEGHRAVELFFTLSGFVFFWLYFQPVHSGKVTAGKFAALRFSRLYPLHLFTLCAVALGQSVFFGLRGEFFVYKNNSLVDFLEHFFLVSEWGKGHDFGFNGPIWSVSVEVFLYGTFFLAASLSSGRWWQLGLIALAGFGLEKLGFISIGRGVFCFYLGGLAHLAYQRLRQTITGAGLNTLLLVCLLLWATAPFLVANGFFFDAYKESFGSSLQIGGKDVFGALILYLRAYMDTAILFPMMVLTLALNEHRWKRVAERMSWIGNISYSSYLLHFPLQLLLVLGILSVNGSFSLLQSRSVFIAFFTILVTLSLLSYARFERPMQNWLRLQLMDKDRR